MTKQATLNTRFMMKGRENRKKTTPCLLQETTKICGLTSITSKDEIAAGKGPEINGLKVEDIKQNKDGVKTATTTELQLESLNFLKLPDVSKATFVNRT